MPFKIICLFIVSQFILGCATAPPAGSGIWVTGISESVTRYYIPATTWQEQTNHFVTCRLDITYVNESGRPVVCNISFFHRDAAPNEATPISFMGDGRMFSLNDVNTMFTRAEYNELRITSVIAIEELLDLFRSEKIVLKALIDSVEYTFEPTEEFLLFRSQFLEAAGSTSH